MKDRTVTTLLAGLLILFFLIYFPGMRYIFHHDGSISYLLNQLKGAVIQQDWDEAQQIEGHLLAQWESDSPLLTLNYGEQDFSNMEMALSQIAVGIDSEDQRLVLSQTKVAIDLLENMHRIVPRP